jgi:bacterioferritin-associated ferredoxin
MSSESRARLVCRCLGVASPRLFAAIRAGALASVAEVTKAARAGGVCGLCHPEIEEILAEAGGAAVAADVSLENEAVCRQETRASVERALAQIGVAVRGFDADGLRVRVRVAASLEAARRETIRRRLRAIVCEDLEVSVEADEERVG